MPNRLSWKTILAAIVTLLAIGFGLYFGVADKSLSMGVFVALLIFFLGVVGILYVNVIITSLTGSSALQNVLWDSLVGYFRKHREVGLRFVAIVVLLLLIWSVVLLIAIYQSPPESAIRFIRATIGIEVILFLALVSGLGIAFQARMTADLHLSDQMAMKITPELLSQSPQAAVEHAFTVFEDELRKRVGADPDVHGEKLINVAYGNDGHLVSSAVSNEQQGIRNLMSGAYATFRNPRKHRIVEDDIHIAQSIVVLVDLLIQLIKESRERVRNGK